MTNEELNQLPALTWMPSRIPVRDALVASVPKGVEFSKDLIPQSYEQRWYPQQDGSVRLSIPYDGGAFDSALFEIESHGWDHTTCNLCNARIPGMTLCYVTNVDPYIALCLDCYAKHIVNRRGILKRILWHAKRLAGLHAAA
jgi:hypothetical protein